MALFLSQLLGMTRKLHSLVVKTGCRAQGHYNPDAGVRATLVRCILEARPWSLTFARPVATLIGGSIGMGGNVFLSLIGAGRGAAFSSNVGRLPSNAAIRRLAAAAEKPLRMHQVRGTALQLRGADPI